MNFSSGNENNSINLLERREFVSAALRAAGISMLLTIPCISNATNLFVYDKEYTVQDVIDIILKEVPGAPFKQTVDTIKSGSADQKVSGIVTTMFATVDVIKQAAQLKANFIIAHEPTFYNHTDDVNWVSNNAIVRQKQELLSKNNIVIWRFHDYWHAHRPDGIGYGVLKKTGWRQYFKPGEMILTMPATSLKEIVQHLKSSLGIDHVRVIGDLSQSCERIALLPGAAGGQMQISIVEKEKPDLLLLEKCMSGKQQNIFAMQNLWVLKHP